MNRYEDLGDDQFETLMILRCRPLLGASVKRFAKDADGGRDAKFVGTAELHPSKAAPWVGMTIVQAILEEGGLEIRSDRACNLPTPRRRAVGGVRAAYALAISAIEHGTTPEGLAERPALMTVTNVNSPRRVDEEIQDNITLLAEHGQTIVITPFTLMGAMAPVALAGALAQKTAEAMGIIALVQMIRPGCPCVLGGFASDVDMRTGTPAFGTPEYVHATLGGARIARAFGLPYRSSAVCALPAADAPPAYETGFSLWASIMSHPHLTNHATGWLEGGLAASFEKIIIDAEMLRTWAAMLQPVAFTDDDLAVEAILATPPGGHFFSSPHTLARYENAFWQPMLSDWSNYENWRDASAKDATQRAAEIWTRTLASSEPPPFGPAMKQELGA